MTRRSHPHYVNTLKCSLFEECLAYVNNLKDSYESAKIGKMCGMKGAVMSGFDGKLVLVL